MATSGTDNTRNNCLPGEDLVTPPAPLTWSSGAWTGLLSDLTSSGLPEQDHKQLHHGAMTSRRVTQALGLGAGSEEVSVVLPGWVGLHLLVAPPQPPVLAPQQLGMAELDKPC